MTRVFSINEIRVKPDPPKEKSQILCDKHLILHEYKVDSLKNLTGNVPSENEIFFMWTLNSFNAFTFVPFIIKNVGIIDELIISTYSINRRIIDAFMRYFDAGKILNLTVLISDSLKYRLPKVYDHLQSLIANRPRIWVIYAWNHSKIALARSGKDHFVFEGSGNFSENSQYEQYILINSQKIYEFRRQCISDLER